MGFPMGYAELFLPKLIVHILTTLDLIRRLTHSLLSLIGLGFLTEPDPTAEPEWERARSWSGSVAAVLIRELLPVVRYDELPDACRPESCAVCLYDFDGEDEIRRLANCRHVFHRACVDRWMDHDQKTCPLCRALFVPEDMLESFNERLWVASGISDFSGDVSAISE